MLPRSQILEKLKLQDKVKTLHKEIQDLDDQILKLSPSPPDEKTPEKVYEDIIREHDEEEKENLRIPFPSFDEDSDNEIEKYNPPEEEKEVPLAFDPNKESGIFHETKNPFLKEGTVSKKAKSKSKSKSKDKSQGSAPKKVFAKQKKEFVPKKAFLDDLMNMGFSKEDSIAALKAVNNESVELAVDKVITIQSNQMQNQESSLQTMLKKITNTLTNKVSSKEEEEGLPTEVKESDHDHAEEIQEKKALMDEKVSEKNGITSKIQEIVKEEEKAKENALIGV